jgi:hypothetical protein
MGWMVFFMCLFFLLSIGLLLLVALANPKRHEHASKLDGYTLVECSYHPLSDSPTYRKHVTRTHELQAAETTVQGQIKSAQSRNWAGYVVAKDLGSPERGSVQSASASWTVPRLAPPPPPKPAFSPVAAAGAKARAGVTAGPDQAESGSRYSTVWVGVDGFGPSNRTVQQIGTASDWDSGRQVDYAWFQVSGRPPMMIANFPVSAGDTVSAAVKLLNAKSGQFRITIRNNTRGVAAVVPSAFTASPHAQSSTAAFVVEAPYDGKTLPLADFGSVAFHDCVATIDGRLGPLDDSDRQTAPLHLVTDTHQTILRKPIANTSNLAPDGKSFNVNFLSNNLSS